MKKKFIIGDIINGCEIIRDANNGKTPRECIFKCGYCNNEFQVRLTSVTSGNTNSCGCYKKKALAERVKTHGLSKTSEFNIWQHIKDRCFNSNNKKYKHYGGRGIKVCKEWIESFEQFLMDMGSRPTIKHTIERIDTNGDYCKGNCKWATKKEQNRNRTITKYVTYNEIEKPLSEWIEELKLNDKTVRSRLENGWSVLDAFTRLNQQGKKYSPLNYQ